MRLISWMVFSTGLVLAASASEAFARGRSQQQGRVYASASGEGQAQGGAGGAQDADVGAIKERYWARGEESSLGVVQNRTYTKAGKVEIGLLGGVTLSDPFLSIQHAGGSLGYHFNEYFGLHAFGWKSFTSGSSALDTLERK
jgi:hypothetical protein